MRVCTCDEFGWLCRQQKLKKCIWEQGHGMLYQADFQWQWENGSGLRRWTAQGTWSPWDDTRDVGGYLAAVRLHLFVQKGSLSTFRPLRSYRNPLGKDVLTWICLSTGCLGSVFICFFPWRIVLASYRLSTYLAKGQRWYENECPVPYQAYSLLASDWISQGRN